MVFISRYLLHSADLSFLEGVSCTLTSAQVGIKSEVARSNGQAREIFQNIEKISAIIEQVKAKVIVCMYLYVYYMWVRVGTWCVHEDCMCRWAFVGTILTARTHAHVHTLMTGTPSLHSPRWTVWVLCRPHHTYWLPVLSVQPTAGGKGRHPRWGHSLSLSCQVQWCSNLGCQHHQEHIGVSHTAFRSRF